MAEPKVIKTTEEKLSSVEEQIEKKKTEISLGQKRLRDLQKERDKLIKQKDKEYADKLIRIIKEKALSDEERSKCLKLFATVTEQVTKEKEEKNSPEQKPEVKTETDFSSQKENIPNGQLSDNQPERQNNSQAVKTETRQEPQSKTLGGLSFFRK